MTELPPLTQEHQVLLAVLSLHVGAPRGMPARALAEAVNRMAEKDLVNDRQLRHLVVDLRLRGHHVCATPEHGYFMAADEGELSATCMFLYRRGMTGLKQVAAMRKVSLPDLAGQLRIRLEPPA